ncbi:MAG: ribonuclease II [Synechococcus sp. NP17]|nr:ribonuclease II [Synechococcus sp. NP17]
MRSSAPALLLCCRSSIQKADPLASSSLHPGDLVGVQESKGIHLAVVESLQGSKARLKLGFDRKSVVLPLRQLDLICPLPVGSEVPNGLGALPWQLTAEQVNISCLDRRSWVAAWVLLLESDETVEIEFFSDLVCGGTSPAQLALAWLALTGPQLWFRYKQDQIKARSAEELKPLRRQQRRVALEQLKEQRWKNLLNARQKVDSQNLPEALRDRLEQLKDLVSGSLDFEQLDNAVQQSLIGLRLGQDRADIRLLLVDLGLWDPHQLVSIAGTTWSSGFSPALLEEAQRLVELNASERPGDSSRVDLCHQRCVTIDDEETRDIDDGLALERREDGSQRLWIHIADPGRLIEVDSALDLEARRRGSSLYLAKGNLPMFPESLSTGPFSLKARMRTAAWSIWVELTKEGEIGDHGIERSWVQPTYRLSYEDADELIELAPPEDPDLAELDALLSLRRDYRVSNGALLMDLPEGRIRCRDAQPSLEISEPGRSRQMVAEAMILAGAVVARFAELHDLALPFRSQLPAELPPNSELEALPAGAVRFAAIKRCLSRGLMGTQPAAHFSLGLASYAQATSPIRRYGDLVVQRQLEAQLSKQEPINRDDLQILLNDFDASVREGIGISREDQRHWQQVWFEQHQNAQWNALFLRWLRPQDQLGLVRIEDLAMDVAAECPRQAEPGDAVLIKVQHADSLRDQLRLMAINA